MMCNISFEQLLSSFNNKTMAGFALASCGHTSIYRRALEAHITDINVSKTCTCEQREIILQSLDVVCDCSSVSAISTVTGGIIEGTALDEVIVFLLWAFLDLLELNDTMNLTCVIRVATAASKQSANARYKLRSYRVFQKFMDAILSKTEPVISEGDSAAQSVIDISLKSQLMIEVLLELKILLNTFTLQLTSLMEEEQYSEQLAENSARLADSASVLRKSRKLISSLVNQHCFTPENESLFRTSKLIPNLIDRCVFDDLTNCSHLLKIFVIFGDNTMLLDMLLQENAQRFAQLFLATMRCPENSIEDTLVKFWLVKRTCENVWLRNFLFQREGVILEILAIMRTTNLNAGDSLDVLTSFCEDIFFLDMSLSTAQMISHFGEIFQFNEHSDSTRHNAEEILLIFAEGLTKTCKRPVAVIFPNNGNTTIPFAEQHMEKQLSDISESISGSFIDSGLLYILLSTISVNDSTSEWRAKGANLLNILVQNPSIQEVFLDEPLGMLRCLVNSCGSFTDKSFMYMELISIMEVLASNPSNHVRLFESDVVKDIFHFMNEVQAEASKEVPLENHAKYLLRSLNLLDILTSVSVDSCTLLKGMKLEDNFTLLLKFSHDKVLEIVRQILLKIYS